MLSVRTDFRIVDEGHDLHHTGVRKPSRITEDDRLIPPHSPIPGYPKPTFFDDPSGPLDPAKRLRPHVADHELAVAHLVDNTGLDADDEACPTPIRSLAVGKSDGLGRRGMRRSNSPR